MAGRAPLIDRPLCRSGRCDGGALHVALDLTAKLRSGPGYSAVRVEVNKWSCESCDPQHWEDGSWSWWCGSSSTYEVEEIELALPLKVVSRLYPVTAQLAKDPDAHLSGVQLRTLLAGDPRQPDCSPEEVHAWQQIGPRVFKQALHSSPTTREEWPVMQSIIRTILPCCAGRRPHQQERFFSWRTHVTDVAALGSSLSVAPPGLPKPDVASIEAGFMDELLADADIAVERYYMDCGFMRGHILPTEPIGAGAVLAFESHIWASTGLDERFKAMCLAPPFRDASVFAEDVNNVIVAINKRALVVQETRRQRGWKVDKKLLAEARKISEMMVNMVDVNDMVEDYVSRPSLADWWPESKPKILLTHAEAALMDRIAVGMRHLVPDPTVFIKKECLSRVQGTSAIENYDLPLKSKPRFICNEGDLALLANLLPVKLAEGAYYRSFPMACIKHRPKSDSMAEVVEQLSGPAFDAVELDGKCWDATLYADIMQAVEAPWYEKAIALLVDHPMFFAWRANLDARFQDRDVWTYLLQNADYKKLVFKFMCRFRRSGDLATSFGNGLCNIVCMLLVVTGGRQGRGDRLDMIHAWLRTYRSWSGRWWDANPSAKARGLYTRLNAPSLPVAVTHRVGDKDTTLYMVRPVLLRAEGDDGLVLIGTHTARANVSVFEKDEQAQATLKQWEEEWAALGPFEEMQVIKPRSNKCVTFVGWKMLRHDTHVVWAGPDVVRNMSSLSFTGSGRCLQLRAELQASGALAALQCQNPIRAVASRPDHAEILQRLKEISAIAAATALSRAATACRLEEHIHSGSQDIMLLNICIARYWLGHSICGWEYPPGIFAPTVGDLPLADQAKYMALHRWTTALSLRAKLDDMTAEYTLMSVTAGPLYDSWLAAQNMEWPTCHPRMDVQSELGPLGGLSSVPASWLQRHLIAPQAGDAAISLLMRS